MTGLIDPKVLLELLPVPGFICTAEGFISSFSTEILDILGMVPTDKAIEEVKAQAEVYFSEGLPKSAELPCSSGEVLQIVLHSQLLSDGSFFCVLAEEEGSKLVTEKFHSQRLQTLGMLAGGVAHDFNNMLAGILGHITYLKTILPKQGPHVESLSAIEEGARKASGLTQQILNFSKLSSDERPCRVEISALLQRTTKLLRGALPPGIRISCVCEGRIEVLAVEAKLAQVVVNLVINARDAVGKDGHISIQVGTSCEEEDSTECISE